MFVSTAGTLTESYLQFFTPCPLLFAYSAVLRADPYVLLPSEDIAYE